MSELRNQTYQYFQTDDIPTEQQFQFVWNSLWFKDEKFSITDVTDLELALQNKLGSNHTGDENAHTNILLKKDASNLTDENKSAFKQALNIGELPDNIATIDDVGSGIEGNVFDKDQIRNLYMAMADYVVGGKIRADKIEALGLTDLIQSSETSLAAFAANSANYEFQPNDFIAIPINGNYSLYLFKGGNKATAGNYLATGLSNITVAMVEGLQTALNGKMDKPTADGLQMVLKVAGGTSYFPVNPATNYLLFFGGNGFTESALYRNSTTGNIGFGTTNPSEQIHLTGRMRAKAVVLEDTAETLPQQITYNNRHAYLTDSTGTKKQLLEKTYEDYLSLWAGLNDAQKTEIKTIANGGWTTNTMSVAVISPPLADNSDKDSWFTVKGANLNLPPTSFKVELMNSAGTTVVAEVPNSQVQLYTNGTDLVFYYNFKDIPIGVYRLRLWNGVAYYVTGAVVTITVVDDLTPIALGALTWETIQKTAGVANVVMGSGNGLSLNVVNANYPVDNTQEIVAGAKSSLLVAANKNFYIKGNFTIFGGRFNSGGAIIGVGADAPLTFVNTASAFIKGTSEPVHSGTKYWHAGISGKVTSAPQVPYPSTLTAEFIIIRNGNNCSVIISAPSGTIVALQTISEAEMHIFGYVINGSDMDGNYSRSSIAIIEGYEF